MPCSELTDESLTAFEPEAPGVLIEGKEFHKFYFDNGEQFMTKMHAISHQAAVPTKATRTTVITPQCRVFGDTAIVTYIRVVQIARE